MEKKNIKRNIYRKYWLIESNTDGYRVVNYIENPSQEKHSKEQKQEWTGYSGMQSIFIAMLRSTVIR